MAEKLSETFEKLTHSSKSMTSSDLDERLNKTFQKAVDSKKMPGCGGIILNKSGDVLWKGAFGTLNANDPSASAFKEDTPLMIFSCTKLLTTVVTLQLLEEGKLSLDDHVEKYLPKIADIKVFTGFDEDGTPKLRSPKTKPTILNMLTHTAGFTYDFFDDATLKYRMWSKRVPATYMSTGEMEDMETPLIFDPGQEYCYGINVDWLGFALEKIEGKSIADIIDERILKPLKMTNSGRAYPEGVTKLDMHLRDEDGNLVAIPEITPAEDPEVYGGGHFVISTLADYPQFLLTILNGGEHPKLKVRILKPETVTKYLFTDQLSQICSPAKVGLVPTSMPPISRTGEFLPGVKKTWSAGLLLNIDACPKGRSAGSGGWAGLSNLYYFIDPEAGKLAFFTTEVFPFLDLQSLHLWDEMERAMYGIESKKEFGEEGGNHGPWTPPTVESLS